MQDGAVPSHTTHWRKGSWPQYAALLRPTLLNFAFEPTRKRKKDFPSETHVKRGDRIVGGEKDLMEKLGRNDPCVCGSGRRFQEVLNVERPL